MKSPSLVIGGTLACLALLLSQANAQSEADIPHLRKQGAATQLIVDGRPFLALAGELGNNSATSPGPPLAGLATVEEGRFVDGRWTPGRLLAGDDTGQGEHIQLRSNSILRVTLYRYR